MNIALDEQRAMEFLHGFNLQNPRIKKIAGDASFRSYYRIANDEQTFILMFAPPKFEDVAPFIKIDEFLVNQGFKAPKIFAQDLKNGFLLLEDFGDATFGRLLKNDLSDEKKLYQNAVDCLISLHKKAPPRDLKNYNHALLYQEVELLVDWYLPFEKQIKLSAEQKSQFKKLFFALFDRLNFEEKCLVLRDYHADNLMAVKGENQVGLLDFQDAVIGSKTYDLVSLLEDARRDVDENLAQEMINYYLQKTGINREEFLRDYAILSLQRNIKILGIFSRLARRDNKMDYLNLIERVQKFVLKRLDDQGFEQISQFLKIMI